MTYQQGWPTFGGITADTSRPTFDGITDASRPTFGGITAE